MVMSHGTYTFLGCFAGFWLVWAAIVLLCCFCSFLQRRLKRRREDRLREQCPQPVEAAPLSCHSAAFSPPPACCPPQPPAPHPTSRASWVSMLDTDVIGKPPCYEEAVLMEDPPPPYNEVLADPRGGTYLKPAPPRAAAPPLREDRDAAQVFAPSTCKASAVGAFPDRGYSSLVRLPSSQRWDSLGHLLSNMDLNHNNLSPPGVRSAQAAAAMATMPRREPRTHQGLQGGLAELQGGLAELQGGHTFRGLEAGYGMPTAFPLLGRSTAV